MAITRDNLTEEEADWLKNLTHRFGALPSMESLESSEMYSWADAICGFCGADASIYHGSYFCNPCYHAAVTEA